MQLGFELMIRGMGSVFSFFMILIFCTIMMSKIVIMMDKHRSRQQTIERSNEPRNHFISNKSAMELGKIPDETLIVIISAAIHQHRHKDAS